MTEHTVCLIHMSYPKAGDREHLKLEISTKYFGCSSLCQSDDQSYKESHAKRRNEGRVATYVTKRAQF